MHGYPTRLEVRAHSGCTVLPQAAKRQGARPRAVTAAVVGVGISMREECGMCQPLGLRRVGHLDKAVQCPDRRTVRPFRQESGSPMECWRVRLSVLHPEPTCLHWLDGYRNTCL